MNTNRKKDHAIFLIVLAVTAVVFIGGIEYSNGAGNQNSPELATNVASTIQTEPIALPTVTSKASSTVAITNPPRAISTTNITTSAATHTSTAVMAPPPITVTPTSTPTPPAPTSAPAPTPVVAATTTPITLPYSNDTFGAGDGWATLWGNFVDANDTLTVGANNNNGGGGAVFSGTNAGTNLWSNYDFTATFDWLNGGTLGLIARYTDDFNFVACEFNENYLGDVQMTLEQHENGIVYTLAQGDVIDYDQWGGTNLTASIQVDYSQGSCTFDGHTITMVDSGGALNPPYSGGIGFTTWDSNSNNNINHSQVTLKSLEVDQLN